MKTLLGFALGTMLSLGAIGAASAATSVAAPAPFPAGIEVIVVTAKRPVPPESPIEEIVATAKRPTSAKPHWTPPVMTIEIPKIELAVGGAPVVRL